MSDTNCPRCGLKIRLRAAFLAVEHCPRCLAFRGLAVPMLVSEDRAWQQAAAKTARRFDGAPRALAISVRENGTTTQLVAGGEWDLAEQPTARKAIKAAVQRCPECLVLDLSQLSFIDSSGIHMVLELHSRCTAHNIRLVIIPGARAIQRPFEVCGLIERLPFVGVAA